MKMKSVWGGVLVIASSLVTLAAAAPSGEPIVLGELVSQSGPFAMFANGHKGAQLAVEQINATDGVLGRPLELLTHDDKSNPAEGTKLFRELASKNVLAIIGNSSSSVVFAANPMSLELKMPYVISMGYSHAFTEKLSHRYFFSTITSDRVFAYALAENLSKQPATRYCTVGNDFVYGRSITAAVMGRLKILKPTVQVIPGCEFWVPMGQLDFTPQITAIMGQKPDALMFGGVVGVSSDAFVKQAKAFRLFSKMLGAHPSLGMPTNNRGLQKGDVPEGILTGSDYPYPPVDTKISQAFFTAYKERWNELPYEISANAYASIYLIAKTIEKAGKVDREALVDAMPGMNFTHPVMGEVSIRAMDHQSTSGWWLGYLAWDEKNNVVGLRDMKYMLGTTYLPTQEELRKIRGQ